jgi:hypothetical protein
LLYPSKVLENILLVDPFYLNSCSFLFDRKFIYEFELKDNPGVMTFYQKEKHMACIEVPFSTVVGLNIPKENPHQLLIEVNSPASTYLGKQVLHSSATGCALPTKYDTTNPVDLTDGQILAVPYHQVWKCSKQAYYAFIMILAMLAQC